MTVKAWVMLLFLIPNILFGKNYIDYYKGINNGKLSAADQNIQESIQSYYSTFEKFDFVFARDCYNAIELAAFVKDTVNLAYFIRRGIRQGLKYDQILKIENVAQFSESTFLKIIEKEKPVLENSYKKKVNWKYRKIIIKMFKEDQDMRKRYYDAPFFKRRKIGLEWERLNECQIEEIIKMTQLYGFPGEKLIGIDTQEMHPKIYTSNCSAGMPIVLFIHHYSQPNKSYDSLLFEQVKLGNLYNEHFATICDFEAEFGKDEFENYGYFAFKQKLKRVNEEEINNRRKEIALLSINEFEKLSVAKSITKFWNRLY